MGAPWFLPKSSRKMLLLKYTDKEPSMIETVLEGSYI